MLVFLLWPVQESFLDKKTAALSSAKHPIVRRFDVAHERVANHRAELAAKDISNIEFLSFDLTLGLLDELLAVGSRRLGAPFLHSQLEFNVLSEAVQKGFGEGGRDQIVCVLICRQVEDDNRYGEHAIGQLYF